MNYIRNIHNNDPDDLCTVQRKKFFELQDMLITIASNTNELHSEIRSLTNMIGGNITLHMYHEQKGRADQLESELAAQKNGDSR